LRSIFSFQDDDEPTQADVGKFIPQAELEAWWKEMQKQYPHVFRLDDPCPSQQHPIGTKLKTYFDNDPNKPMRVEVLGSKLMPDMSGAFGKYPKYIVKFKDSSELTLIHFTEAHEEDGWKVGW